MKSRPESKLKFDKPPYQIVSGIYALCEPTTNRVMYVGLSHDIERRYRQHVSTRTIQGNRKLYLWIDSLRRARGEPILSVLEYVEGYMALEEAEERWITHYRQRGEAEFNIAPGGSRRSSPRSALSTCDDWHDLGRNVRLAIELLWTIQFQVGGILDVTAGKGVERARLRLESARDKLDTILWKTFPEREDNAGVFYGKPDAKDDPRGPEA